jgi:2-dehydropantoate 2-reductase
VDEVSEIVVVGAGGIGGTFAALLARSGSCRVTLLGRPGAHLDAICRNGLRMEGLAELTADVAAVDDPAHVRACDVLIYAVKTQDTESAVQATSHIAVRDLVTSLQNGVATEQQLIEAFGAEGVIGALAVVAGERSQPGVVRWTYDGGTLVGELDGSPSERVERLVGRLRAGGLDAAASSSIVAAIWTKLVGWVPIGLLATLARQTNAGVLSNELLAKEYIGMVRELAALAATRGVEPIDLGPFHVRTWLAQPDDEAVRSVMGSTLAASESTHSALQDIRRGARTELGTMLAPLLAEATEHSVPMPRVTALYAALMGLEETIG